LKTVGFFLRIKRKRSTILNAPFLIPARRRSFMHGTTFTFDTLNIEEQYSIQDINRIASSDFIAQVEAIEPSNTGGIIPQKYRPCRLMLADGQIIPRAICVENHRGFTIDSRIFPNTVVRIEPSAERMPADLASKLYAAGESGMGYVIFRMTMKDGTSHIFVTGNTVDFPDLPNGYTTEDIQNVFPHEGREESKHGYKGQRAFLWCYYKKKGS
jgi:hypothetical protein